MKVSDFPKVLAVRGLDATVVEYHGVRCVAFVAPSHESAGVVTPYCGYVWFPTGLCANDVECSEDVSFRDGVCGQTGRRAFLCSEGHVEYTDGAIGDVYGFVGSQRESLEDAGRFFQCDKSFEKFSRENTLDRAKVFAESLIRGVNNYVFGGEEE